MRIAYRIAPRWCPHALHRPWGEEFRVHQPSGPAKNLENVATTLENYDFYGEQMGKLWFLWWKHGKTMINYDFYGEHMGKLWFIWWKHGKTMIYIMNACEKRWDNYDLYGNIWGNTLIYMRNRVWYIWKQQNISWGYIYIDMKNGTEVTNQPYDVCVCLKFVSIPPTSRFRGEKKNTWTYGSLRYPIISQPHIMHISIAMWLIDDFIAHMLIHVFLVFDPL